MGLKPAARNGYCIALGFPGPVEKPNRHEGCTLTRCRAHQSGPLKRNLDEMATLSLLFCRQYRATGYPPDQFKIVQAKLGRIKGIIGSWGRLGFQLNNFGH
jgi:hypothetical protein